MFCYRIEKYRQIPHNKICMWLQECIMVIEFVDEKSEKQKSKNANLLKHNLRYFYKALSTSEFPNICREGETNSSTRYV